MLYYLMMFLILDFLDRKVWQTSKMMVQPKPKLWLHFLDLHLNLCMQLIMCLKNFNIYFYYCYCYNNCFILFTVWLAGGRTLRKLLGILHLFGKVEKKLKTKLCYCQKMVTKASEGAPNSNYTYFFVLHWRTVFLSPA